MSSFGLIEENMELSHIHLAVMMDYSKTKIVTNNNIFEDLDNLSFVVVFSKISRSQTVSRIFWSENYKTHSWPPLLTRRSRN